MVWSHNGPRREFCSASQPGVDCCEGLHGLVTLLGQLGVPSWWFSRVKAGADGPHGLLSLLWQVGDHSWWLSRMEAGADGLHGLVTLLCRTDVPGWKISQAKAQLEKNQVFWLCCLSN